MKMPQLTRLRECHYLQHPNPVPFRRWDRESQQREEPSFIKEEFLLPPYFWLLLALPYACLGCSEKLLFLSPWLGQELHDVDIGWGLSHQEMASAWLQCGWGMEGGDRLMETGQALVKIKNP